MPESDSSDFRPRRPKPRGDTSRDVTTAIAGIFAAVRERAEKDGEFRDALGRLLGFAAGESGATPEPARGGRSFSEHFDAELIARRCRLKAAAARWQVARRDLPREVARPGDDLVLTLGRELPDCYLWMCNAAQCRGRGPAEMGPVADAYRVLAEAAELVGSVDLASLEQDDDLDAGPDNEALQLLAEAQSMLHVILGDIRTGGGFDADQMSAFVLAKTVGGRRRTFFNYMARDDRADPAGAHDLLDRVREADPRSADRRADRLEALLADARVACDAAPPAGDVEADDPALAKLRLALSELLAEGVSPDDERIAGAIAPLLNRLAEDADESSLGAVIAEVFDHAEGLADDE